MATADYASIVRTIHMWPLGQPHKLWLVPNFSTRGPPKNHCSASTQSAVFHGTASLSFSWLSGDSRHHPITCLHGTGSHPVSNHIWNDPFTFLHASALEPKAHCYYYLWLWLVNMYIYYYELLFSCLCMQNRNWFCILICLQLTLCATDIVCSVLCILQLCTLEQLIK